MEKKILLDEESISKLHKISGAARKVLDSVGEIIWMMNKRNDNLNNLYAYLRRFASDYFELYEINCLVECPDNIPFVFINSDIRRNIFLVVKEALHNIVKHAKATQVRVELEIETDGSLYITISDDGIGLHEKEEGIFGNGLLNMKQRIKDIDGKFSIETGKIKGTTLFIRVKVFN